MTYVFWLMIMASRTTPAYPVFLPEPFTTESDCEHAGEAFKASNMDLFELGSYVCFPKQADEARP